MEGTVGGHPWASGHPTLLLAVSKVLGTGGKGSSVFTPVSVPLDIPGHPLEGTSLLPSSPRCLGPPECPSAPLSSPHYPSSALHGPPTSVHLQGAPLPLEKQKQPVVHPISAPAIKSTNTPACSLLVSFLPVDPSLTWFLSPTSLPSVGLAVWTLFTPDPMSSHD